MSLSCSCKFDEDNWYWDIVTEVKMEVGRRHRCCSCRELINIASDDLSFSRQRQPNSDIEERIYGDEVPLANWYMCDSCGGLFFALDELGFCIILGSSMPSLVREYNDVYRRKND